MSTFLHTLRPEVRVRTPPYILRPARFLSLLLCETSPLPCGKRPKTRTAEPKSLNPCGKTPGSRTDSSHPYSNDTQVFLTVHTMYLQEQKRPKTLPRVQTLDPQEQFDGGPAPIKRTGGLGREGLAANLPETSGANGNPERSDCSLPRGGVGGGIRRMKAADVRGLGMARAVHKQKEPRFI